MKKKGLPLNDLRAVLEEAAKSPDVTIVEHPPGAWILTVRAPVKFPLRQDLML